MIVDLTYLQITPTTPSNRSIYTLERQGSVGGGAGAGGGRRGKRGATHVAHLLGERDQLIERGVEVEEVSASLRECPPWTSEALRAVH